MILEIELVPRSSWFDNVRSIVSSKQWDIIRHKVYSEAYNLCQICGGVGPKHPVECHEIWSYNDKKNIQKLEGMIALCPKCHMVKHIGFAQLQNKGEQAIAHFMKINKLTRVQANAYIEKAFATWDARSKCTWSVDISHLSTYGLDVDKLEKHE